jgi:hypothetical protein
MKPEKMNEFKTLLDQLNAGAYKGDTISVVDFGLNDNDLKELLTAIKKHPSINKQIRVLDISKNKFDKPVIDGLLGLSSLTIEDCSASWLVLRDLPQLLILRAARNKLMHLIFVGVTTLLDIDLHINRLRDLNVDQQKDLVRLNVASNWLKILDVSLLRKINCLQINGNRAEQLYLGANPLAERFDFSTVNMTALSLLQVRARCKNKPEAAVYNDIDVNCSYRILPFDASAKLDTGQLGNLLQDYYARLKQYKLDTWMLDAMRVYIGMQFGKPGYSANIAMNTALRLFKFEVNEKLFGMFEQLQVGSSKPAVQLAVELFIKVRVKALSERLCENARENMLPQQLLTNDGMYKTKTFQSVLMLKSFHMVVQSPQTDASVSVYMPIPVAMPKIAPKPYIPRSLTGSLTWLAQSLFGSGNNKSSSPAQASAGQQDRKKLLQNIRF